MWLEIKKWAAWFGLLVMYSLMILLFLLVLASIPSSIYLDCRDHTMKNLQRAASVILSNPSEYIIDGPIVENKQYKQVSVKIDDYTGVYIEYQDKQQVILNAQVWGKDVSFTETLNNDAYILGKKTRQNLGDFISGFTAD